KSDFWAEFSQRAIHHLRPDKPEARSPKPETNSKSEGSKAQNSARLPGFAIRISVLRVCFEFRVSDFGFWTRSRFLCGTIVKTRKLFLHERLARRSAQAGEESYQVAKFGSRHRVRQTIGHDRAGLFLFF